MLHRMYRQTKESVMVAFFYEKWANWNKRHFQFLLDIFDAYMVTVSENKFIFVYNCVYILRRVSVYVFCCVFQTQCLCIFVYVCVCVSVSVYCIIMQ